MYNGKQIRLKANFKGPELRKWIDEVLIERLEWKVEIAYMKIKIIIRQVCEWNWMIFLSLCYKNTVCEKENLRFVCPGIETWIENQLELKENPVNAWHYHLSNFQRFSNEITRLCALYSNFGHDLLHSIREAEFQLRNKYEKCSIPTWLEYFRIFPRGWTISLSLKSIYRFSIIVEKFIKTIILR